MNSYRTKADLLVGWRGLALSLIYLAGFLQTVPASGPSGQVVGWGGVVFPYVEPGTKFTKIAAGGDESLPVKVDGNVSAWRANPEGNAFLPPGITNVVAVAQGKLHSIALKSDGTVIGWGD